MNGNKHESSEAKKNPEFVGSIVVDDVFGARELKVTKEQLDALRRHWVKEILKEAP